MKESTLILYLLAITLASAAQSDKHKKHKYDWPEEKPVSIPVEEQFKNEDAVILEEKCIYSAWAYHVTSQRYIAQSANYFYIENSNQGLSPLVQKHLRIKFLTDKGIRKFSSIVLPESFDPVSDWNTMLPEERDTLYRPKGQFECINHFAARIIKPDGKIVNAIVNESTQTEYGREDKVTQELYNWIFRVINLEPGDELELDYSYEGVFNIDPSVRIFFNGDMPKQNYHLTFRYPERSNYILLYSNGAEPNDSVMVTISTPRNTEYYFSRKNLVGGIREIGARPQNQLPFFTFYEHKLDYGIADPKTKFITKPLPYPWKYVFISEAGFQEDDLNLRLKRKDQTTRVLNEFVNEAVMESKDTSLAGIMSGIQHTFAADFDYEADKGATQAGEAELEHLGKYVLAKTIREVSRFRLYTEVFKRLDREYFLATMLDKRVCNMNFERFEALTSRRFAFAVPVKNTVIYFYPKSYRSGYETNELPFYYEDINAGLIPQHEPAEKKYELVPEINSFFVRTPFSGVKDNTRNSTVLIRASIDSMLLSFNAKVKLTGQFSTITRGYYLYGDRDTTVNPEYYVTLSDLADEEKTVEWNSINTSREFPFEATFGISFKSQQIKKMEDGRVIMDLSGWFNNVIDPGFSAINRHLDYYPDFQFQDSHKYMISFDRKIRIDNSEMFQKTIENSFANYSLKITQVSDESILLESSYIVKPEKIPALKAKDVEEVFSTIKELNRSALKLVLQ